MIHLVLDFIETRAVLPGHLCADLSLAVCCGPDVTLGMSNHAASQSGTDGYRLEPGHSPKSRSLGARFALIRRFASARP